MPADPRQGRAAVFESAAADKQEGGSYLSTLGTPVANTMLVSSNATGPDGRDNALQISDGTVYQLASGKTSSGMLNGRRGTLVVNSDGKAVTFVPDATAPAVRLRWLPAPPRRSWTITVPSTQ